ncbi:MAG: F0F1 ATP synthase subunit B [Actinobacteria bacterium]|nr:F0F1 ATP synthase subunit B [Actinomycetota bacterium]
MLIDWFTVVAEIVNFLILLWLLKRFLYKPILNAMDKREATIAAREHEATTALQQGRQQQERYEVLLNEISSDREEILAEAHRSAEQRRAELTQIAADDVAAMEARWKESVERQREAFARTLAQRAGDQICSIARLALADLAGTDLERHIVGVFIQRLHALPEATRRRIVDTVRKSNYRITITSSFDMDAEQRREIQSTLNELVGREVNIAFEASPDVICGIDLRAHEYKLAFSLGDYLERLRVALEGELQTEASAHEGG